MARPVGPDRLGRRNRSPVHIVAGGHQRFWPSLASQCMGVRGVVGCHRTDFGRCRFSDAVGCAPSCSNPAQHCRYSIVAAFPGRRDWVGRWERGRSASRELGTHARACLISLVCDHSYNSSALWSRHRCHIGGILIVRNFGLAGLRSRVCNFRTYRTASLIDERRLWSDVRRCRRVLGLPRRPGR